MIEAYLEIFLETDWLIYHWSKNHYTHNSYCWGINFVIAHTYQLHNINCQGINCVRCVCVSLVSVCLASMIAQTGNYTTIMLGELMSKYTHTSYTTTNCWGINCVIIPAPLVGPYEHRPLARPRTSCCSLPKWGGHVLTESCGWAFTCITVSWSLGISEKAPYSLQGCWTFDVEAEALVKVWRVSKCSFRRRHACNLPMVHQCTVPPRSTPIPSPWLPSLD